MCICSTVRMAYLSSSHFRQRLLLYSSFCLLDLSTKAKNGFYDNLKLVTNHIIQCRRGKVRSNFRATDKLIRSSYIAGRRTECKDVQLQCDSWYDTHLSLGLSHLGWQTTKFYQQMLTKGCKLILTGRNEMAWTQTELRAVRLVFASSKCDHITLLLRQLHWLKVPWRIDYKLAVLVYKYLHGLAPALSHLADELH